MKSIRCLVVLALLASSAGLVHAGPSHEQGPRRPAINPQPLPPRRGVASARDAINPQPLPPRTSDSAPRAASARPYIGETESN